jgi:hypothetical protein
MTKYKIEEERNKNPVSGSAELFAKNNRFVKPGKLKITN